MRNSDASSHTQKLLLEGAAKRGELGTLPEFVEQFRCYRFRPVGTFEWFPVREGHDDDPPAVLWVWQSECRYCGEPFWEQSKPYLLWPDRMRVRNCPLHRGKNDPLAVQTKGAKQLKTVRTKRRQMSINRKDRESRTVADDMSHAAMLAAVRVLIDGGEYPTMSPRSECYLPRIVAKRNMVPFSQAIALRVARTLIEMGAIRVDVVGRYSNRTPRRAIVIPA